MVIRSATIARSYIVILLFLDAVEGGEPEALECPAGQSDRVSGMCGRRVVESQTAQIDQGVADEGAHSFGNRVAHAAEPTVDSSSSARERIRKAVIRRSSAAQWS